MWELHTHIAVLVRRGSHSVKGENEEKSAADMVSEAENVVTARQLPGLIPASFTALSVGIG